MSPTLMGGNLSVAARQCSTAAARLGSPTNDTDHAAFKAMVNSLDTTLADGLEGPQDDEPYSVII